MPMNASDPTSALAPWPQLDGGELRLINHSENRIYAVETPDGGRFILRVHRAGYQSPVAIESELAWLDALAADTDLPLPRPIPGRDGRMLQKLGEHLAVAFTYIAGIE